MERRCDITHSGQGFMFTRDVSVTPVEVNSVTRRHLRDDYKRKSSNKIEHTLSNDDANSMHRALRLVMLTAQFFALCPVRCITSHRAEDLRFTWRSFRVAYASVVIISFIISIGFAFSWFLKVGFTFKTSGALVFHVTGLVTCILFLKLGTRWPELSMLWQQTEHSQLHYGYPKKLRLQIRSMAAITLILAIVEYGLSNANSMYIASCCSTGRLDFVRRFFVVAHRHVFGVIRYSSGIIVFTSFVNIIGAFYWSFSDLFIMLISVALASRFRLFNHHLNQVKGKVMTEGFWRSTREDYNALSYLTMSVDSCISSIVLLCFATNLFYICQQLLNSMNNSGSTTQMIYFYISFGYLILRTVAMALYAASICDESKVAKDVLFAVPAHSYDVEVHRFVVQVATDNVVLTGLNFFPVTRTALLTLHTYRASLLYVGGDTTGLGPALYASSAGETVNFVAAYILLCVVSDMISE